MKAIETKGYDFKVNFFDEKSEFIDSTHFCVEILTTECPEADQRKANGIADAWAEEALEDYGADSYELHLDYIMEKVI